MPDVIDSATDTTKEVAPGRPAAAILPADSSIAGFGGGEGERRGEWLTGSGGGGGGWNELD